MKNYLKKIFGSSPKKVPEQIQRTLLDKFPGAINIDWEFKEGLYEAIFYLNDVEHIAKVSEAEGIFEYKINLKPTELPYEVFSPATNYGEIMNAISIHRKLELRYEIIVRDEKFNRTLLLLNSVGELLNSKKI